MTTQKEIILLQNQIEILKKHAKSCVPNESCAILFGKILDNKYIVKDIFPAKNIENSSYSFTISPEELIKAYETAEKRSLDVIAIFHSHPDSSAYPSSTDKKFMETNPVPWIIYSNSNNELNAYILESDIVSLRILTS
jgi:proteasome lid subunit RPN8/RPN11